MLARRQTPKMPNCHWIGREGRDVMKTYEGGGNSYIIEPADFEQFTEAVRDIGKYGLEINHLTAN